MIHGKTVPRSKCLIDGNVMYFDLWNSKEKTNQKDTFEYLGYGRVVSSDGVSKEDEKSEFWTGHFWRSIKIPENQSFKIVKE